MTAMPRSAIYLGLAGLMPFVWSIGTEISPGFADSVLRLLGPRFIGPYVALAYGTIILSFMSGVLWGFATNATGRRATIGYTLSVLPALWTFFFVGNGAFSATICLMVGYLGLTALDYHFWRSRLAPVWWMTLRLPLTAAVVGCLWVSVLL